MKRPMHPKVWARIVSIYGLDVAMDIALHISAHNDRNRKVPLEGTGE